jgi:hypothetical protein
MGEAGISPEKATHAILHALTAKHPKTRYYVGRDAQQFNLFSKLLPDRLCDWMVVRNIGLRDEI